MKNFDYMILGAGCRRPLSVSLLDPAGLSSCRAGLKLFAGRLLSYFCVWRLLIDHGAYKTGLKRWGRALGLFLLCLAMSSSLYLVTATAAQASTTQSFPTQVSMAPSQQPMETIQIHLGSASGALVFEPDHLTFVAGQRYQLLLDNPSATKHYFTAKDFADIVWSQKVQVGLVEVKGTIHELELKPNAVAEWFFIPQKPGTYELHCSIAGHAEAGMRGVITVSTAS